MWNRRTSTEVSSEQAILLDALESHADAGAAPFRETRREAVGQGRVNRPVVETAPWTSDTWSAYLSHFLGSRLERGHHIRSMRNGSNFFPAMLESIRGAQRSIEFLFFIVWDGETSNAFCEALIRKAADGVAVRVLLDAVGSLSLSKQWLDRLKESEVELRTHHPVSNWKFWRTASRNHRKILVVDDRVAYLGGTGIADEWRGHGDTSNSYRETQFRVTGPSLAPIKAAFFANWAASGGRLPKPLDNVPQRAIEADQSTTLAAAIPSSVGEHWNKVSLLFQLLCRGAQNTFDIATPYFVPGQPLVDDLLAAARRGVRIRIMLSGKRTDHRLPLWAGRHYYEQLLAAGIEIHEYDLTLMHVKLFIVDRRMTIFGSANMNQRSQSLDEEIAMATYCAEFAENLTEDFAEDLQHCRAIDSDQWAQRSWIDRAKMQLARRLEFIS